MVKKLVNAFKMCLKCLKCSQNVIWQMEYAQVQNMVNRHSSEKGLS